MRSSDGENRSQRNARMRRTVLFVASLAWGLFLSGCNETNLTQEKLEKQLRADNPSWTGSVTTSECAFQSPMFEFQIQKGFNSLLVEGGPITEMRALRPIRYQILGLKDTGTKSLDFLEDLRFLPNGVLFLENLPDLTDFSALSNLEFETISLIQIPQFTDTTILPKNLKGVMLDRTGVTTLEFEKHTNLKELLFYGTGESVNLSGITSLKKLNFLELKNLAGADTLRLTGLEYLESLLLQNADLQKLPILSPRILTTVALLELPELKDISALNGRTVNQLVLSGLRDPAELLQQTNGLKVLILVIQGANLPDLSFLRQLSGLRKVVLQNCTNLPDRIEAPHVEFVIDDI